MAEPTVAPDPKRAQSWLIQTPHGQGYRVTAVTHLREEWLCSWCPDGRCEHVRRVAEYLRTGGR